VYDIAAMPTRHPIPLPTNNKLYCDTVPVYYDTIETNLLQTCKLVRDEAQTIFDRAPRNLAPVLAFTLKDTSYQLRDTVTYTGWLIAALLEGVNSSQNEQVNFEPLKNFALYFPSGQHSPSTVRDSREFTERLRPIYHRIVHIILHGKELQVRVLLEGGFPPPNRAFWDDFCLAVGSKVFTDTTQTSRSGLRLVFVTPPGKSTACREQISHLGGIVRNPQGFARVPTDLWSVEEGNTILDAKRD
jgi:hypothetical protein